MGHLNKRKPNLSFSGFCFHSCYIQDMQSENWKGSRYPQQSNLQEILLYSMTHTWLPRFTLLTLNRLAARYLVRQLPSRLQCTCLDIDGGCVIRYTAEE